MMKLLSSPPHLKRLFMEAVFITLFFMLSPVSADSVSLKEEARLRHLMPLPQEIQFHGKYILEPSAVSLQLFSRPGKIAEQAVSEFREFFSAKTGVDPFETPGGFKIFAGIPDENTAVSGADSVGAADRLRDLPNNAQAYILLPARDGLLMAALDEKGLYYGFQTLSQLLEPQLSPETVCVPIVEIVDWPDLEERGVWNVRYPPCEMASLKLNFMRIDARLNTVQRGEPLTVTLAGSNEIKEMRRRAFVMAPTVTHLNFLNRPGSGSLFEAYPEAAGRGEQAFQKKNPSPYHQVPCTSEPLFTDILADILKDIASNGMSEADVWQSEFPPARCECPDCMGKGQFCGETDAIIEAWRRAREEYPDFGLRIFFSLVDNDEKTYQCLMNLPADVKAGWVYGPRRPFDELAGRGHWVASWMVPAGSDYDFLGVWQNVKDLQAKGWSAAYGYSASKYGMASLAEAAWNVKGRDEREFAAAWAVREGYDRPEDFADWCFLIGPVKQWQHHSRFGLRAVPAIVGESAGAGFHRVLISEYLKDANEALAFAERLQAPELIGKTEASIAYLRLLGALKGVLESAVKDLSIQENRIKLVELLDDLEKKVSESIEASGGRNEGGMDWFRAVSEAVENLLAD